MRGGGVRAWGANLNAALRRGQEDRAPTVRVPAVAAVGRRVGSCDLEFELELLSTVREILQVFASGTARRRRGTAPSWYVN